MKKFSIFVLFVAAAFFFIPQAAEAGHLIKNTYVTPSVGSYLDSRSIVLTLDKDTDDCEITKKYKYVSGREENVRGGPSRISITKPGTNKRGTGSLGILQETTSFTVSCTNRRRAWPDHHDEATVVAKVNPTVIVSANGSFDSLRMEGTEPLNISWSASTNARSCKLTSPYSANNLPRFGSLPTINPGDSSYPQDGAGGSRSFLLECTEDPGGQAQPPGGWGKSSKGVYVFIGARKPAVNMYLNGVNGNASIKSDENLTVSWNVDGNGWGLYGCDYPDAINPPRRVLSNLYKSFPFPWPPTYSDSVTYAPGDSLHPSPDGRSYVLTCYSAAGNTVVNHSASILPKPEPPPSVSLEIKKSSDPDSAYAASTVSITSGEEISLKWSVDGIGVASCNWTLGLTGPALTSGGTTNASPTSDTDYSLRCTNFEGTGDSNVVSVTVTDPPPIERRAVLRVQSSGVSNVPITRVSGTAGIGDDTNYTRSLLTAISGTLEAPASWGGKNFSSWSSCDSTNNRQCSVNVALNESQTVVAHYESPLPLPQCSDGLDNDLDSLVDWPADPGCDSSSDNSESNPPPQPLSQCSDGLDNDLDSLVDWPADPGCDSFSDNNESDPPPPPAEGSPTVNTTVPSGPESFSPDSTQAYTATYTASGGGGWWLSSASWRMFIRFYDEYWENNLGDEFGSRAWIADEFSGSFSSSPVRREADLTFYDPDNPEFRAAMRDKLIEWVEERDEREEEDGGGFEIVREFEQDGRTWFEVEDDDNNYIIPVPLYGSGERSDSGGSEEEYSVCSTITARFTDGFWLQGRQDSECVLVGSGGDLFDFIRRIIRER